MNRLLSVASSCLVVGAALFAPSARADEASACDTKVGIYEVHGTCEHTRKDAGDLVRKGPQENLRYEVRRVCMDGTEAFSCFAPRLCAAPPGTFRFSLYRSPVDQEAWTHIGYVCLGNPDELEGDPEIDLTLVLTQWRALTWPEADMVVQPPDGETLVNLDTIFYTSSTQPELRTLPMLGQTLQIEATPDSYTWHWAAEGDGATAADLTPHVTTDPGAPHPHATITHRYSSPGITVHPRLDLTYRGRYRVNNGPWQDIPETRTITGTRQAITVLEAPPTLVN